MSKLKIILLTLILICFWTGNLTAQMESDKDKEDKSKSLCPKTLMTKDCLSCHTIPSFKLKGTSPHEGYEYPSRDIRFEFDDSGKPIKAIILFSDIVSSLLLRNLQYAEQNGVRNIIIEIDSWGGELFDSWRASGIIRDYIKKGFDIESRVYGKAFSAGFLVFVTPNKRLASKTAELMWHETWIIDWTKISTKSTKEEELKVMRHIQDNANAFIASKSTAMTKLMVDVKTKNAEFWLTGQEAFELGFVTGFLD